MWVTKQWKRLHSMMFWSEISSRHRNKFSKFFWLFYFLLFKICKFETFSTQKWSEVKFSTPTVFVNSERATFKEVTSNKKFMTQLSWGRCSSVIKGNSAIISFNKIELLTLQFFCILCCVSVSKVSRESTLPRTVQKIKILVHFTARNMRLEL